MTTTAASTLEPGPAPGVDAAEAGLGLLSFARTRRADANRAEVDILIAATDWAELHPAHYVEDAAVHEYGDQPIPVAGPGAPWVEEFAVAEFAAALRMSTDAGKRFVGEALELRHRLLRLWAAVVEGDCLAWRARRVAAMTITLPVEGAEFVDRQLAGIAHSVSLAQLDRLITEAKTRYAPEQLAEDRDRIADHRFLTIEHDQLGFTGTASVTGVLDAVDAHDLDSALRQGAARLAKLGSTDSLDVRRSIAAGELARHQLALDLDTGADTDDSADSVAPAGRALTLHVHISADALTGTGTGTSEDQAPLQLARVEETRTVVTAGQIREWCGRPGTKIVVKPVIDLQDHVHVTAYEVPDRIAERTDLRDLHCVFPYCTRPARRCDHDHICAHATGGATCTCNLAPLCRRHHRLKTHAAWSYTPLEPGSYLWTSPHGLAFVRDHHGTRDVTTDVGTDRVSTRFAGAHRLDHREPDRP